MTKKICTLLIVLVLTIGLGCSSSAAELSSPASLLLEEEVIAPAPVIVVFPDSNLDAVIREAIGKPKGAIYTTDLEGLVILNASRKGIVDLTGIKHCTDLRSVNLNWNLISNLTSLAELPGGIVQPTDEDGKELASFTSLWIGLAGNLVDDISPLAALDGIDELYLMLNFNQVGDLSSLVGLTNLIGLYLCENEISDISSLANLTRLSVLDLWGNEIEDLSPLQNLVSLSCLNLDSNKIKDISSLSGLVGLDSVYLGRNQVSSLSSLKDLVGIEILNLTKNEIEDVSPLVSLVKLKSLDLSYNQIVDASVLDCFDSSVDIKLEGNPCSIGDG